MQKSKKKALGGNDSPKAKNKKENITQDEQESLKIFAEIIVAQLMKEEIFKKNDMLLEERMTK